MGISLEGAANARADANTQIKARWADLFDEVDEIGKLETENLDQVVDGNTPTPAETKPCALQKKEDGRAKKLDGPMTLLRSAARDKGRGLRWCAKVSNSVADPADVQPAGNQKSLWGGAWAKQVEVPQESGTVLDQAWENSKKKQCQFIIGIEEDPVFRVGRRLLGPHGSHMKSIAAKTGCRMRLRGRGSRFLEGPYHQESTDPLMLCVSSPSEADHVEAVRLIEELLLSVYAEFRAFCKSEGWQIPHLRIRRNEGAREGAARKGAR